MANNTTGQLGTIGNHGTSTKPEGHKPANHLASKGTRPHHNDKRGMDSYKSKGLNANDALNITKAT